VTVEAKVKSVEAAWKVEHSLQLAIPWALSLRLATGRRLRQATLVATATHRPRMACTRNHLATLACTRRLRAILVAIRTLTLVAHHPLRKVMVQRCATAAAAATATVATVTLQARSHMNGDCPAALHVRVGLLRSTASPGRAAAAQLALRTKADTTAVEGESSGFALVDVSQCA